MQYYLISVWGGVDASLHGPYPTSEARDAAAVVVQEANGPEGSVHALDVDGAATLSIADYDAETLSSTGAHNCDGADCRVCDALEAIA